jgi:hypothetical protein
VADGAEAAAGRLRWHFSPQYFTSSQLARHFLRYSNGRPQVVQILVGSWPLRSLAGSMAAVWGKVLGSNDQPTHEVLGNFDHG